MLKRNSMRVHSLESSSLRGEHWSWAVEVASFQGPGSSAPRPSFPPPSHFGILPFFPSFPAFSYMNLSDDGRSFWPINAENAPQRQGTTPRMKQTLATRLPQLRHQFAGKPP